MSHFRGFPLCFVKFKEVDCICGVDLCRLDYSRWFCCCTTLQTTHLVTEDLYWSNGGEICNRFCLVNYKVKKKKKKILQSFTKCFVCLFVLKARISNPQNDYLIYFFECASVCLVTSVTLRNRGVVINPMISFSRSTTTSCISNARAHCKITAHKNKATKGVFSHNRVVTACCHTAAPVITGVIKI